MLFVPTDLRLSQITALFPDHDQPIINTLNSNLGLYIV